MYKLIAMSGHLIFASTWEYIGVEYLLLVLPSVMGHTIGVLSLYHTHPVCHPSMLVHSSHL